MEDNYLKNRQLVIIQKKTIYLEDLMEGDLVHLPTKIAKFFQEHYNKDQIQKLEFIDTSSEYGFQLVTYDYETQEAFLERTNVEKQEQEKERNETIRKIQIAEFLSKEQKDGLIYDIINKK